MRDVPKVPATDGSGHARAPSAAKPPVVALVGNPNTGKTALFNALTGFRRHVANYPGVTVDFATGPVRGSSSPIELLDLPGAYSLAATSPDERILCHALCGHLQDRGRPAAILAIVDASNPVRNFYLVSQLLEVGLPVVVALNMVDLALARGIEVDTPALAERLGVPVVPVVATQAKTVEPLIHAIETAITAQPPAPAVEFPQAIQYEAERLCQTVTSPIRPCEALRMLVAPDGDAGREYLEMGGTPTELSQARRRLKDAGIEPGPTEVRARYTWVNRVLGGVVQRKLKPGTGWSDRIDRVLTHRLVGTVTLLLALYGVFYSIFAGAQHLMEAVEGVFGWMGGVAAAILPEGILQSLIVDGLLAGVGGVVVFLPQILILFMFIAILEDCGYLSRAAFMVDRLLRPLGLSGRAFIPLLSSFACAVPAIMGTRAIADRRERFITILIAPFMSCSARLPIYILMISAFVPARHWLGGWIRLDALVMLGVYSLGVIVAIPIAILLRKTAFAGPGSVFLLELPSYKLPRLRSVLQRVYLAGSSFIVRAGTVILLVNIVVWALGYFPRSEATLQAVEQQRVAEGWDDATFQSQLAGAYLRDSYLGHLGHTIEPVIRPIGWDWRIGIGVVASFPAREVIIATLGTVLNLGSDTTEESVPLQQALRRMVHEDTGEPLFTLPVALSLMVFFALCAQCAGTLVTIGKETGSWMWPLMSFGGMTTLAYVAAWAVATGTRALGW